MVRIVKCHEVTPGQGHAVIMVSSPEEMLSVYENQEEVTVFKVGKGKQSEYWIIGEILDTVYVGDDFEERTK